MLAVDFFNEILQCFTVWVNFLFTFSLFGSISAGHLLVAIAIMALFVRIFIVRLKNG